MFLVYWKDAEVSKYKNLEDFMHGRDNYNEVHMATSLRIENGEIKATHWSVDELEYHARKSEEYYAS